MAIDCKLRSCDLVKMKIVDVVTSGHTKMDSTVGYLAVELEDDLAIAEAIEI